jgi:pyridoxal phosphate enzyme (YggS family)
MPIENASLILKKMSHAAMRAGRCPSEVKLIAVTKTVDAEAVKKAFDAGLRIFGESRVQEAQKKISSLNPEISGSKVQWHLIGHLQKNKTKYAVQLFDLIHTVDSVELAKELDRQAEKAKKVQNILIQVKLSDEETKQGISEEELSPLLEAVNELKHLNLMGLMTIPPYFEDAEKARPYFRKLREIRDNINALRITHYTLRELSMGMSHDFEAAIEEGSTMVRIGTAIFGERPTAN